MNSPAIARPPGRSRLVLIVAGVLALLGSFAATAPAQAGYYGDYGYGSPCSSPCGYRHYAPRYYNPCSRCGCYRRCGSFSRGVVYERRFVERQYVERRYGGGCGYGGCGRYYGGYGRPYGYDGGYGGYRRYGGYYPYGGYRTWSTRRYPWGWGGVRGWRGPYGNNGYEPSADEYAGGNGYDAGPNDYEGNY